MKLVYGITASVELTETKNLINFISQNTDDEIVVQIDSTKNVINPLDINAYVTEYPFNNNFADFKNHLNEFCRTLDADYIFHLDADEMITEYLIKNIKSILEINQIVDLFFLPRINTVEGITSDHLSRWKWNRNEKGYINFPDYQGRIYKSHLKWFRYVHEQIIGAENISTFPFDEKYCILHHKNIVKQEEQNNFYKSL